MISGVVGQGVQQRQQQRDGQGGIEQIRQTPEVVLHYPYQASLLEAGHVAQKVESDPEQREAAEADAQRQQEFPEQVAVEEAHQTWQSYAGSIRLTNCGLQDFHGAAGKSCLWRSKECVLGGAAGLDLRSQGSFGR